LKQKQEERQRQMRQDEMYRDDHDGGGNREVPDGAGEGVGASNLTFDDQQTNLFADTVDET
jgi:hypothetical protein